jgi:quinol monooxygenase YgiN
MIIIHATIDLKPSVQDEAIPACIEHQNAGLREPGCTTYVFTLDPEKPGRLHVLEQWESIEALTEHMHTPRSEKFAKLMSGWAQSVSVSRFKVLEDQSDDFRRQSETLMGDTVQA